jgi:hypothetical protein
MLEGKLHHFLAYRTCGSIILCISVRAYDQKIQVRLVKCYVKHLTLV